VLARLENDGPARTFCPRKAKSHRFGIVVQAGATFTRSVLDTVQKMKEAEIGIYNVAGGNSGLARAIDEAQLVRRPLYMAHEVNGLH
jgi:hypothetical protein